MRLSSNGESRYTYMYIYKETQNEKDSVGDPDYDFGHEERKADQITR